MKVFFEGNSEVLI